VVVQLNDGDPALRRAPITFCTSGAVITKSPLIAACPAPTGWKLMVVVTPKPGGTRCPSSVMVSLRARVNLQAVLARGGEQRAVDNPCALAFSMEGQDAPADARADVVAELMMFGLVVEADVGQCLGFSRPW
jgi:hypothetical protein